MTFFLQFDSHICEKTVYATNVNKVFKMSEAFDKKRNSARRLREIADIIEKNERIVCKDFILPGHSEYDLTAKVEYNVAIDDGMEVLQMARVVGCVYNSITDGKYDWTNTVKAIETTLWEIRRNLRNDINDVMPGALTKAQSRAWHKYKVQNVRFAAMLLDNAYMLRCYLEPLEMRGRAERAIFEEHGKMIRKDNQSSNEKSGTTGESVEGM